MHEYLTIMDCKNLNGKSECVVIRQGNPILAKNFWKRGSSLRTAGTQGSYLSRTTLVSLSSYACSRYSKASSISPRYAADSAENALETYSVFDLSFNSFISIRALSILPVIQLIQING